MEYIFTRTETTAVKLKAYSKLLSAVFVDTNKFTQAFLHWQYAENPEGSVVGFDAYFDGKLVAHYVTIPVCYLINGKKTKGLLSLNTVIHPEHQGKKLFTLLAQKTYEEAKHLGYGFVVGVANQNSTHGFLKKLGFYLISPLQVKIGFGKATLDKNQKYTARPYWSLDACQWRFSNPSVSYLEKGDQVFARANKFGLYAQLCDLDATQDSNYDFKRKRTVCFFKVLIGLAKRKKALYVTLPAVLKPSPLNLIFKDLKGGLPILKAEDIFFELIDFDAY